MERARAGTEIKLTVSATSGTPLSGSLDFHVHHAFPEPLETVEGPRWRRGA
jgi:hypothetical protein